MAKISFDYMYDDTQTGGTDMDKLSKLVRLGLMSHAEANKIIDSHHGRNLIYAEILRALARFPMGLSRDALIDHIETLGHNRIDVITVMNDAYYDGYLEYLPLGLVRLAERKEGKM